MKPDNACVNLEKIALQIASSLELNEVLTTISQGLVDELGAAFARIWLFGAGDLCDECHKATICEDHERCLHLKASAGIYTNLNGEYRRVPFSESKLGRIATTGKPIFTSNLMNDNRFPNKTWIGENALCSYGGYPLIFRNKLLGTIAMFSQHEIQQHEFEHIAGFANQASIAIKNAQLYMEVEQLKNQLQAECNYLREEIKLEHNHDKIIGQSAALNYVLSKVDQIAATDTTVLILGETGTGKELIARAIHGQSARRDRSLVKVNCASLPANLIESELFGHEKGAFTSAQTRQIGRFELAEKLETSQVEEMSKNKWVGLEEVEKEYILRVLKETRWKVEGQDGAAQLLDLNPSTLRGRMRKLGIQRP